MPGMSPRAHAEWMAWLHVPMRCCELRVLGALWGSLPVWLEDREPRDIEVYLTVREIAEMTGLSTRTVHRALRGLEHDVGAVYRTPSIRDYRRPALWLQTCERPASRVQSGVCHHEIASLTTSNACDEGGRFPSEL